MEINDQQSSDDMKPRNKRKSKLLDRPDKHPRTGADAQASQDSLQESSPPPLDDEDQRQACDAVQQHSQDWQQRQQQVHDQASQQQPMPQGRVINDSRKNGMSHDASEGSSGSDSDGSHADNVPSADKYIRGTRLVIGGWFQACRGCNEPTAHTACLEGRDVPLCPRCQDKFNRMAGGQYPDQEAPLDVTIEPLCYWLPRMLAPMPPMAPEARRTFCSMLVLRQDDAWNQLCRT